MARLVLPLFIVDSFTDQPFAGNPAAVCLLSSPETSDEVRQNIAAEMNLSETAFLEPLPEAQTGTDDFFNTSSRFSLRWFTPTTEVPLCGHGTLAAASVLFDVIGNTQDLRFETVYSGTLVARRLTLPDGKKVVEMDLPLNPPHEEFLMEEDDCLMELVRRVLNGTGFKVLHVKLSPETKKLVIRIDDEHSEELGLLNPTPEDLTNIDCGDRVRGVIVTVKAGGTEDYDFKSRYFAPWVGIPEDPVTGSAHTVLAPYWSEILGKSSLFARQCSKRGGDMRLVVDRENRVTRIRGESVVVLKGQIVATS